MESDRKIIVILGPTASGKSDLGVALAQKFKGEIISADSRQIYKGVDIGSGKITKKEMAGVPHHLLNIISPKKTFTIADFKKLSEKKIDEIYKKEKLPFIVGGTGFYIQAITDNISIPEVKPDWNLRKKLEKKSNEELFKILQKLDAKRSQNIDKNNPRRLIRAIEIATHLGKVPQLKKQPAYNALKIGIKLPGKKLEQKIRARIQKMLKRGLIKETKNLREKYKLNWKRIEELGFEYKYPALFLQGKLDKKELLERLALEHMHYAKRQMTWFSKYAPDTHWIKNTAKAEKLIKKFLK